MSYYAINNISIVPPSGSVMGFLGTVDPSGWVIADGNSRTNIGQYNSLLNLGVGNGTTGSSNNPTTYTPPNFLGAFLRGISGSGNYVGPASVNTSQTDSFASHTHSVTDPGHNHNITDSGHTHTIPINSAAFGISNGYTNNGGGTTTTTNSTTGITINNSTTGVTIQNAGGTETRPYNYGVNWIIKL